jgi:hypothetical protein
VKPPSRLRSKLWTPQDDERLRSLAMAGTDTSEIAMELERSVAAVRARVEKKLGLSLKRVMVRRRSTLSRWG